MLVGEGSGDWRLRGAALALDGRLARRRRQAPVRFHPLASEDVRLTLAGNRIHATGTLSHPASHTRIALATIDHDLATGAGRAILDVPELRFTPAFQPEALTPLTVGIVALVDGKVSGQGRIDWDARGSRQHRHASRPPAWILAAPFGPVEGLSTRIALHRSARPDQRAGAGGAGPPDPQRHRRLSTASSATSFGRTIMSRSKARAGRSPAAC